MSSTLSMNVKRLGHILKEGAEVQVGESGQRLEGASSLYWPVLSKIVKSHFRFDRSCQTASEFFGGQTAKFAAIDGSMNQNLLGGLAVFWAGAYAATGTVLYRSEQSPVVTAIFSRKVTDLQVAFPSMLTQSLMLNLRAR